MEATTTLQIFTVIDPAQILFNGILILTIWFFGLIFYFKKQTILR